MTVDDLTPLSQLSGQYILDPAAKREPYSLLHRLREDEPVHRTAAGTWIVSGYDLAVSVLRDERFGREAATQRDIEIGFEPGEPAEVYRSKTVNRDGVDHLRLRRLLTPAFTPAAVRRWRPYIEEQVDKLFAELGEHGECDVVDDIAYPIPEHVICTLLGVPFEDHKKFEEWTLVLNARPQGGGADGERKRIATAALSDFVEYLRALVAQRRTSPRDDLVTQLISLEEGGERLSERELIAVMTEIINGGHDTTANTIVNGCLMLLQHPEQFARLRADPELVPSAVEEIMRFRSSVQLSLTRVTTEDVELDGVVIPEGSTVVVSLAGANREAARFADPDEFDVARSDNRHLSFGSGGHFCLGAHLARLELAVTFDRIVRHMPDLHLTVDVESLPWRSTTLVMAPASLPVAW